MPKSITVQTGVGPVFTTFNVEVDGYSPDLADDIMRRVRDLFGDTLREAVALGLMHEGFTLDLEDEDEDEDEEVTDG